MFYFKIIFYFFINVPNFELLSFKMNPYFVKIKNAWVREIEISEIFTSD